MSSEIEVNNIVWAKLRNKDIYWPAITVDGLSNTEDHFDNESCWVYWFGVHKVSHVRIKNMYHFVQDFIKIYSSNVKEVDSKYWKAILECVQAIRDLLHYDHKDVGMVINWIKRGCPVDGVQHMHIKFTRLPDAIEVNMKQEGGNYLLQSAKNSKPNLTSIQLDIIEQLKNGTKGINTICIRCVKDVKSKELFEHPYFECKVCQECHQKLMSVYSCRDDDGVYYYCFVCAYLGDKNYCKNSTCKRSMCRQCIQLFCTHAPSSTDYVEENACIFCLTKRSDNGLLQVRKNWKEMFYQSAKVLSPFVIGSTTRLNGAPAYNGKGIRVLSLFDGIGTGLFVLKNKLKINIDTYYSSEIDKDALCLLRERYGDGIIHLGDVTNLYREDIQKIFPIDLVLAGSPCDELSLVNPFRKGLYNIHGTGPMFFEFYRILKIIEEQNFPFFWLYENVASMNFQTKDVISRYLQCEPLTINAASLSPQHRRRFFWGNLPTLELQIPQKTDVLQNHLTHGRIARTKKINCVTTNGHSLVNRVKNSYPVEMGFENSELYITELESIFGFDKHYTDAANLSIKNRQKLLAKAWSVQVISHLLIFLVLYSK